MPTRAVPQQDRCPAQCGKAERTKVRTPNPPRGAHPRREVGVGVWVARPASRRLRKSHCGRCVLAARPGSCQLRPERARVGCAPEPSAGSWAHPLRPGPAQRKGPGAQVLVRELRLGWGHRTTKGRPRTSEAAKLLTDSGNPPLPQSSPQADRFSGSLFAAPLPRRGWSLWVGGSLNFVSSWCGEAAGPFGRRAPGVLERAVTWRASALRGGRILPVSVGLRAQMPGAAPCRPWPRPRPAGIRVLSFQEHPTRSSCHGTATYWWWWLPAATLVVATLVLPGPVCGVGPLAARGCLLSAWRSAPLRAQSPKAAQSCLLALCRLPGGGGRQPLQGSRFLFV